MAWNLSLQENWTEPLQTALSLESPLYTPMFILDSALLMMWVKSIYNSESNDCNSGNLILGSSCGCECTPLSFSFLRRQVGEQICPVALCGMKVISTIGESAENPWDVWRLAGRVSPLSNKELKLQRLIQGHGEGSWLFSWEARLGFFPPLNTQNKAVLVCSGHHGKNPMASTSIICLTTLEVDFILRSFSWHADGQVCAQEQDMREPPLWRLPLKGYWSHYRAPP